MELKGENNSSKVGKLELGNPRTHLFLLPWFNWAYYTNVIPNDPGHVIDPPLNINQNKWINTHIHKISHYFMGWIQPHITTFPFICFPPTPITHTTLVILKEQFPDWQHRRNLRMFFLSSNSWAPPQMSWIRSSGGRSQCINKPSRWFWRR